MSRMYAISRDGQAVTTSNEVWKVTAPASAVVVLHSAFLGQYSDAGDASAEMLRVRIYRTDSNTTGTSGYSNRPFSSGDAVFGGTNTVSSTVSTSPRILIRESFNVQAGWYYTPTPEERITVSPGQKLAIYMGAPADSVTMSFRAVIEEIGT